MRERSVRAWQLWGPKSCGRSRREVEGEDVWVVRDHVCVGDAEGRSGWWVRDRRECVGEVGLAGKEVWEHGEGCGVERRRPLLKEGMRRGFGTSRGCRRSKSWVWWVGSWVEPLGAWREKKVRG